MHFVIFEQYLHFCNRFVGLRVMDMVAIVERGSFLCFILWRCQYLKYGMKANGW
jgi:hypothetical protein